MDSDDVHAGRRDGQADGPGAAEGFEPAEAAGWHWRFSDDADVAMDVDAPSFGSQEDAEGWLAERYLGLLDQGVAAVSLFDGERAAYGPMPLGPEQDQP